MTTTITLQNLKDHEKALKNGKEFPTSANRIIAILKSLEVENDIKMDFETRNFFKVLLTEYEDVVF